MTPEEFILRCLDAAVKSKALNNDFSYYSLRSAAYFLQLQQTPTISFEYLGSYFEIKCIKFSEITNISAIMISENCVYHSILSLSCHDNRNWFSEWIEEEGDGTDLTLLLMGTQYVNPAKTLEKFL